MEILALRLSEEEFIPPTSMAPTNITSNFKYNFSRKLDVSDSNSMVPGVETNALAAVYGIVGPSIVTFGLIGNILILFVVGRSSMIGKNLFKFIISILWKIFLY